MGRKQQIPRPIQSEGLFFFGLRPKFVNKLILSDPSKIFSLVRLCLSRIPSIQISQPYNTFLFNVYKKASNFSLTLKQSLTLIKFTQAW